LGSPSSPKSMASDGFGLGEGHPVAVKVEPVVVGSTAGPGHVVFDVRGVFGGDGSSAAVDPVGEAVAAIGVVIGEENNDAIFEYVFGEGVVAGGETIEGHDGRFGTA